MAKVLPFNAEDREPEPQADEAAEQEVTNAEYLQLMGMTVEDILREGQKALFARLVSACRSGTASHQELAILRNILKDNGLTLGIPPEKSAPGEKLPLPDDMEVPDYGPPEQ
ncbi:hypothetical protein [Mesorhizobium sp. WSM4982]|uniref:hypothetical protein n=1 Tax=Mesorhizobium sp. WSM4982 TaxID=3038550 RepID=UPI00241514A1|nr:hypothetical protein [Mesorhizobium sp. WSM4982]MDG4856434.1 hypothetical protein [Mesorhizobium sp. WSM4982]